MNLRLHPASIAALTLGHLLAAPSFAALGGDLASVTADSASLHGDVQATSLPGYDIHEMTTANGVRVREFIAAGRVFAVTWSGPVVPDLQTLLGIHYTRYARAVAAPPPGLHKSVRIDAADLVVESAGHLRAYVGRAYLPGAVPAGMTRAAIR